MKRKNGFAGLAVLPIVTAVVAAFCKALWLIPVTVVLMFGLVAALPCCKKHENLWMFVLTGVCSIPINWCILSKFDVLIEYLYSDVDIIMQMEIIEYMLVLTGVEEIVIGLVTRLLWKKQYKLYIQLKEDEE